MPTLLGQAYNTYFKRFLQFGHSGNNGTPTSTTSIQAGDGVNTSVSLSDDVFHVQPQKDDGKGMQPISKKMAKKPVKKVTKPDVPPVAIVPSTSRPEKPKKDTRRSPGAMGGRSRGRSPGAMGGKADEYGGL